MRIKRSVIVSAIDEANKPLNFDEIADAFFENVDYIDLHKALAEMVARKRLESWVDDEGRVVYAIPGHH